MIAKLEENKVPNNKTRTKHRIPTNKGSIVEPQISHFVNCTPCEDKYQYIIIVLTYEIYVWSISIIFGCKFVLKFHIFLCFLTCEELVRCDELVPNFYKCEESVPSTHLCNE